MHKNLFLISKINAKSFVFKLTNINNLPLTAKNNLAFSIPFVKRLN